MEVAVHQFEGVSTIRSLPLAAGLLVASARLDPRLNLEAAFSIRTARIDPVAVVESYSQPDVLAFSTYVWNERYSLEVARRAHLRFPDALVIFGGPSVPRRPDRAARFLGRHTHVDALALGEGEVLFREVLQSLAAGRPLETVPGLALRAAGRTAGAILTKPRRRIEDFSATASPYLDGTFDRLLAGGPPPGAAMLETNRGCPFACTFCDWGQAVDSPVHDLPMDRIRSELSWVANRGIPYLYIIDANYGIRRRDLDIVREIGRLKSSTGNPRYVFFHLTKNAAERHLQTVLALRESGIQTHLALSSQDFDPRVLEAVRRDNIRPERASHLRRICHDRGIPTMNELILGLPEQTYDKFAESVVRALTPYPLDSVHLYLARMLENAGMAAREERMRHGIETRRVGVGSFHHQPEAARVREEEEVVVATRTMPIEEWRRAFHFGFLLTASQSLRLLDVVLQAAGRIPGLGLRAFAERLLARIAEAPPGSSFGRIAAALQRHAASVLSDGSMVLPDGDTGDYGWAVEDAVALVVLASGEQFFSELALFIQMDLGENEGSLLREAVRYQQFLTPTFRERSVRKAEFAYDFPAWRMTPDTEIPRRRTALTWSPSPPLVSAPDLKIFLLLYLSAVHSRSETGHVLGTSPQP